MQQTGKFRKAYLYKICLTIRPKYKGTEHLDLTGNTKQIRVCAFFSRMHTVCGPLKPQLCNINYKYSSSV